MVGIVAAVCGAGLLYWSGLGRLLIVLLGGGGSSGVGSVDLMAVALGLLLLIGGLFAAVTGGRRR
jgi:hypothetical protein